MSNVSISHKIPIFCLLKIIFIEYCFNICFFYKGHDSCHLHLKHSSPNAYITTHFLDLHIPPSCKATFATTIWTLTHESLSILNFTSLKLTFLLICVFSSVMEKQRVISRIWLQVSTGPSAIALVSFPSSLRFGYCTDPCYFFPMTGITLLISVPSLHGPILNTARAIF